METLYAWWNGISSTESEENTTKQLQTDDSNLDTSVPRSLPNPMLPALREHFQKNCTSQIASCTVDINNSEQVLAFEQYVCRLISSAVEADQCTPQGRRMVVHACDILVAHRYILVQNHKLMDALVQKTSNSNFTRSSKLNGVDLSMLIELLYEIALLELEKNKPTNKPTDKRQ